MMDGMSMEDYRSKLRGAFDEQFNKKEKKSDGNVAMVASYWMRDVYPDDKVVIVEDDGKLFKVGYDDSMKFDEKDSWIEGKMTFAPVKKSEEKTDTEDDEEKKEEKTEGKSIAEDTSDWD